MWMLRSTLSSLLSTQVGMTELELLTVVILTSPSSALS